MDKLKAAIIGAAGRIAYGFDTDPLRPNPASHYGAYARNPSIELVGGCDTNVAAVSGVYGGIYRHYKDMMDETKPDIVSVCTPTVTHHDIVVDLATKWHPLAIFCEKPLASTVKEAYSMVAACKDNDTHLAVNYTRRWVNIYRAAKDFLMDDQVTEIIGITNGEANGKVQTHMLDLFNWYRQPDTKLHYIQLPHEHYLIFEIHIYTNNTKVSIIDNGKYSMIGIKMESPSYSYPTGKPIIEIGTLPLPPSYVNSSVSTPIAEAVKNIVEHIHWGKPLYCTGEDGVKTLELAEKLNLAGDII